MPTIQGLDVSNWQARIAWPQVAAAGYVFGICKASQGTTFVDGWLPLNWTGMKAANMVRGCYHYAEPDTNTAEAEAAHFLDVVKSIGGLEASDLVALDLEEGAGDLRSWVTAWLKTVGDALGFPALIYTTTVFMDTHNLNGVSAAMNAGLWLANWGNVQPTPSDPAEFCAIWQNSDRATVPGVSGNCDTDLFLGDLETLKRYGLPAVTPPPKPVFGDAERLRLIEEVAGGMSVADAVAWLSGYA